MNSDSGLINFRAGDYGSESTMKGLRFWISVPVRYQAEEERGAQIGPHFDLNQRMNVDVTSVPADHLVNFESGTQGVRIERVFADGGDYFDLHIQHESPHGERTLTVYADGERHSTIDFNSWMSVKMRVYAEKVSFEVDSDE